MLIRSVGEDAYFAASNSAGGFYSHYTACFDDARIGHLYAIKGGPGTGKSRFLRDVAEYGVGIGWRCEYIYCSSDPNSLDGVILSRRDRAIALLDATAPHVYEPTRPGAREDLVNLGIFWDSERLESESARIGRLQEQKSAAYRRAYRYLRAAGEARQAHDELLRPYIRQGQIAACAARLLADECGVGYSEQVALMWSVGMRGHVGFDSYFRQASEIVLVEDCRSTAQYLMAALRREAEVRGLSVRVSYDPVLPDRIDALFLCESRRLFTTCPRRFCEYPHQILYTRRFIDLVGMRSARTEATAAKRLARSAMTGAVRALSEVKEAHFELESIYSAAMNFAAKENFTKIFCRELFDLQNR